MDTLDEHLQRHYRIHGDIERVPRGRASNYAVSYRGGRWLLKVFQREYTRARIEQAADFVSFAVSAGYPAQEFVASGDGATVVMIEDRAAVLIPWIDGDTPEPNTISTLDALGQAGGLCGHLHRLGAGYPRAAELEYAGSKRGVAEKRENLLRVAAGQRGDKEIVNEINIRIAILMVLGDELDHYQRQARRGVIHGDFSGSHVVFRDKLAVGVIDVIGEHYLPGWELMRAFFQSVPSAGLSPSALEAPWRAYLAGYRREYRIPPHEIAVAYDTYLLQLAASTYGLSHPLDDALREFGRWRTRLAHHLAEHRQELREMMAAPART